MRKETHTARKAPGGALVLKRNVYVPDLGLGRLSEPPDRVTRNIPRSGTTGRLDTLEHHAYHNFRDYP